MTFHRISCITSLYNCYEYLGFFLDNLKRISNIKEVEFIFIHNDPQNKEKKIIDKFIENNETVKITYTSIPRERLYKSWNRGIQMSKSKYIAIWNVDDVRFPRSLEIQANALDENKNAKLAYGDYYITEKFNSNLWHETKTKSIKANSWYKKFQGGCFLMWRRDIHEKIGYFDEQFISLGDQDFWYRVVEHYEVVRTHSKLGIFLNEYNKGISKSSNLPSIEKIIIGARYGFFTYANVLKLPESIKNYEWSTITYNKTKHRRKIIEYSSPYIYLYSLFMLIMSVVKYSGKILHENNQQVKK